MRMQEHKRVDDWNDRYFRRLWLRHELMSARIVKDPLVQEKIAELDALASEIDAKASAKDTVVQKLQEYYQMREPTMKPAAHKPLFGNETLLELPPRKGAAKQRVDAKRYLSRSDDLCRKFIWQVMVYFADETDTGFKPCSDFFDVVIPSEFDEQSRLRAIDLDVEKELTIERLIAIRTARKALAIFKSQKIPFRCELVESTAYWCISGAELSDVEIRYCLEIWEQSAKSALGVFLPQSTNNGVHIGLIIPSDKKDQIRERYRRA